RLSRRIPRALLREAPLQLRAARARRAPDLPRARAGRRRARPRPRAALRPRGACARMKPVGEILDKAVDGERISDDEALALLESRDLVSVGRAADALRARRTDPG